MLEIRRAIVHAQYLSPTNQYSLSTNYLLCEIHALYVKPSHLCEKTWALGLGPWGPGLGPWHAGEVCGARGEGGGGGGAATGPGPWARPWAQAMGPCPCVQEPKLWPMSILTFGPISIFSIPDF